MITFKSSKMSANVVFVATTDLAFRWTVVTCLVIVTMRVTVVVRITTSIQVQMSQKAKINETSKLWVKLLTMLILHSSMIKSIVRIATMVIIMITNIVDEKTVILIWHQRCQRYLCYRPLHLRFVAHSLHYRLTVNMRKTFLTASNVVMMIVIIMMMMLQWSVIKCLVYDDCNLNNEYNKEGIRKKITEIKQLKITNNNRCSQLMTKKINSVKNKPDKRVRVRIGMLIRMLRVM